MARRPEAAPGGAKGSRYGRHAIGSAARRASSIARDLERRLGRPLTALVAGVEDAQRVRAWARGEESPSRSAASRLHAAHRVTELLLPVESAAATRAWLLGKNPLPDD